MFEDVVNALIRSKQLDYTIVVTNDVKVLAKAKNFGIRALHDSGKGLNESLMIATNYCMKMGAKNVTIVPMDIPLIKPEDIDEAVSMGKNIEEIVVISPSKDGYGTNLLFRQPPNIISPRYGVGSFEKHREIALANNVHFKVYKNPRIALDIDKPEDLIEFIKVGKNTKTHNMLQELNIIEKIKQKLEHKSLL
jgi:2-phospho-L-lactate guanylyltransferase